MAFCAALLAVVAAIATRGVAPSYPSGQVVVDGKTILGGDGHPIELVSNPAAGDPSWAQLEQFLSGDETDSVQYQSGIFTCGDFAEKLHNNAEATGIRAGYAVVHFESGALAHACVAFRTTDRGVVFIDDTGPPGGGANDDKTVDLAVGQPYCPISIFRDCGPWASVGTVSSIHVRW